MAYEGVDIKDAWGRPIGLRVKNGVIQNVISNYVGTIDLLSVKKDLRL